MPDLEIEYGLTDEDYDKILLMPIQEAVEYIKKHILVKVFVDGIENV